MYRRSHAGFRIFLLILLIVALVFGGSIWFDYLGLIDAKQLYSPIFNFVGIGTPSPVENTDSPYLLEQERLEKQWESLTYREQELDQREKAIAVREGEMELKSQEILEREEILDEKEKAFNQILKEYDNKVAALRETASQLNNMAPEKAVAILNKYEDEQLLVDVLRMSVTLSEEMGRAPNVPFWLTLMEQDRAARIQEIMVKKPDA